MTTTAEGIAWVAILAWLGLGVVVVLALALARYQREKKARALDRSWSEWMKEQRERNRVDRGRP